MDNAASLRSFLKKFIISLTVCLGGGWLAGLVTQHGVKEWYPLLVKPYGTPPDYIFPIAWSILYFLMAVSLTLLWVSKTTGKKGAYIYFFLQLFFNFIWSWLFFYLENPLLGLIDITILWVFILLTINSFWIHTKAGSALLIPYLVWVSYAFYLNLFTYIYN